MTHGTDDPRSPHPGEELLNDYVDGLLAPGLVAGVERHLTDCADCRSEVAELRALLADVAALPREMTPPRDLWAGIRENVAAEPAPARPARVTPLPARPRERHPLVRYWLPLAAAAAALVVMSSSITRVMMKPGGPFTAPSGAVPAGSTPGGTSPAGLTSSRVLLPRVAQPAALNGGPSNRQAPALGKAERTFEQAAADLRAAFDARKTQLKPTTVATVEENLRIIDEAIRRARVALEADPGNPDLNAMVTATWQKKVELLDKAVRLSSEI